MGNYGPQNFWMIDEKDLVDVDQDLNYNLKRADTRVKALVQYQMMEDTNLIPYEVGYKWWKKSSNSIWMATADNSFRQVQAPVETWNTSGLGFTGGYGNYDTADNRVGYTVFAGRVTLRGRVILNNFDEIPKNVATNFLNIPSTIQPVRSRFLHTQMGTGSTGPQSARIFIPNTGAASLTLQFVAYGPNASSSTQRFICLNGIEWEVNDT